MKQKQNKTKQITRTTGSSLFIVTTEMSLDEFCPTLSVISSNFLSLIISVSIFLSVFLNFLLSFSLL